MARIIESTGEKRRMIKLTTDDIISIVRDYQRIVPRNSNYENMRSFLEDSVIYIPEDI